MSGQAKRSRVRALVRHRRQVARLIVECGAADDTTYASEVADGILAGASLTQAMAAIVCEGGRFDVHAARAYGEQLVREGEDALATWAVYLDWLESTGGPVCEAWCPGCEGHGSHAPITEDDLDIGDCRGCAAGGPSSQCGLCRGWGWIAHCDLCDGDGRVGPSQRQHRQAWAESKHARRWVDFIVPPGHEPAGGWLPGKRPRMDGAALVRKGRRLLAALEGQPSECQAGCIRVSAVLGRIRPAEPDDTNPMRDRRVLREDKWLVCADCRGTGHNLAVVLSPVEWPAVVLRKHNDSHEASTDLQRIDRPQWLDGLGLSVLAVDGTRVVPRGEHRRVTSFCRPELMWTLGDPKDWPTLDERITARGLSYAIPMDRRPRWRRGEEITTDTERADYQRRHDDPGGPW